MNIKKKIVLVVLILLITNFSVYASDLHTVKYGDTLWKISQSYNVNIQEIINLNGLKSTQLWVGQKLQIPSRNYHNYKAKSGDTLWKIANKFEISISDILNNNNINPEDYLYIGQNIKIPLTDNFTYYTVKYGDTLWKIASNNNTTIKKIISLNNINNYSMIYSGQKLLITKTQAKSTKPYITYTTHKVVKGETCWSISIDYKIPYTELLEVNNLNTSSYLTIGQELKIPVHHVPVTETKGSQYGEYLDWWTQAQYVFPIYSTAKVTDFKTGKSFNIKRTYGAFHADCEPLTKEDAQIMYQIYGGKWSWIPRACIVDVNNRKIAASFTSMPHDIQKITDNNFNGHFDIHFLNSKRHKDGTINQDHQEQIKIAAGIN